MMHYGLGRGAVVGGQQERFNALQAVSGPVTLILDQFTDADGTLLTAHTIAPTNVPGTSWVILAGGTFSILSNQAKDDSIGSTYPAVNAGVADCTTTATVVDGSNTTAGGGVIFRAQDGSNFWMARWNNNAVQLYEVNAGSFTLRASSALTGPTFPYTITVVLSGNSIAVTVGAATASYTSASFNTATRYGFRGVTNVPSTTFDNFQVTVP